MISTALRMLAGNVLAFLPARGALHMASLSEIAAWRGQCLVNSRLGLPRATRLYLAEPREKKDCYKTRFG